MMRQSQIEVRMCSWCAQSFLSQRPEHTECSVYPCAIEVVKAERGIDFTPAWAMGEIIKALEG